MTKQKLFLFSFVVFFCIFIPKKIFADSHNYEEIIKIIQQDLKTLEKAVYQKSDVVSLKPSNSNNSDGLNEEIMTKHLLKLNEINQ